MSTKLIILEEAAAMLGMTSDELMELRNRSEIYGYRDGKTWKFKLDEIERFANEREIEMRANPADSVKIGGGNVAGAEPVDIDADLDELVDITEINFDEPLLEIGEELVTDSDQPSGSSSSSTIIGRNPKAEDADLLDALDDDVASDGTETSVGLPGAADIGIEIVDADGSEIKLAEESGLVLNEPGSTPRMPVEDDVSIDVPPAASDSGSLKLSSSDSEIKLTESDDDIVLDDDQASDMEIDFSESLNLSDDDLDITLDSSSEIDLDGSSLRLDGADTGVGPMGSDITLNAGESGINLATPTDSGISLEQTPSEISIGDDEVLELGEAAEIDFEDIDDQLLEDEDSLQADDEFLLTPAGGDAMEESDSGSQVIALDTEEELGEDEATVLPEDSGGFDVLPEQGAAVGPLPASPGLAAAPESGYSLWNVLSLGAVMVPLLLTGIMMLDLVRHIWTWDEPFTMNSSLMDFILSMFGTS